MMNEKINHMFVYGHRVAVFGLVGVGEIETFYAP